MESADEHDGDCVHSGQYGQVKFARAADGSLMVKSQWNAMPLKWRNAFMSRFVSIAADKNLQISSREHFKKIEGDLYEFKHNGQKSRIFTFRHGNCWFLVDVFVEKKEDALPEGVVRRAVRRMEEARNVLSQRKGAKR